MHNQFTTSLSPHRNAIPQRHHPKTHCRWGHPFNAANLYVRKNGKWMCRACRRERAMVRRRASGIRPRLPTALRFYSKVSVVGDCWIWTGKQNNRGYGVFRSQGKEGYAHRWAFEDAEGHIPSDMEIDHLCRIPLCVRPSHLEVVSHQENVARGDSRRRSHCPHGHSYSGSNLYVNPYTGKRLCRTCHRASDRRRRERLLIADV